MDECRLLGSSAMSEFDSSIYSINHAVIYSSCMETNMEVDHMASVLERPCSFTKAVLESHPLAVLLGVPGIRCSSDPSSVISRPSGLNLKDRLVRSSSGPNL